MTKKMCPHHVSHIAVLREFESYLLSVYELFASHDKSGQNTDSDDILRYQHFIQDQLPKRVRQELILAVERELEPVEERLRNQLHEIVRIVHREFLQSFQRSLPQPNEIVSLESSQIPAQPTFITEESSRLLPFPFELTAADDVLGTWGNPSFASTAFSEVDQPLIPYKTVIEVNDGFYSDPGYATMSNSMSNSATPMFSVFPQYEPDANAMPTNPPEARIGSPSTVQDENGA
jgi:hypothetical protein